MTLIENSLIHFNKALDHNKVNFDSKGNWYIEGKFKSFFRWLLCLKDARLVNIAKVYNQCLSKLEKISIKFSDSKKSIAQDQDFQTYVQVGEKIHKLMEKIKSKAGLEAANALKHNIIALKYRLEAVNGGLDRTHVKDESQYQGIRTIAAEWKKNQWVCKKKELNQIEEAKLVELMQYPEFAEHLKNDTSLQKKFFSWVFKHKNSVRTYVEFPQTAKKLREVFLHARIGKYHGAPLQVEKRENVKELQLRVNSGWFNILDENQVITFKNGLAKKVSEIFENSSKRVTSCSDYEMFEDGLHNWNASELGYLKPDGKTYQQVDLTKEKWYEEMPVERTLTEEQVTQKYKKTFESEKKSIKDTDWIVSLMSSRSSLHRIPFGTHSYFKIAQRQGEKFRTYTFGLTSDPSYYPVTAKQSRKISAKPLPGRVNCPDENSYFQHRQHTDYSTVANTSEAQSLMNSIRNDMQKGFMKPTRLVYQAFLHHCGVWSWKKANKHLKNRIPKIYHMDFYDVEFIGVGGKIFNTIKKMPRCIKNSLMHFYFWCLGGNTSMKIIKPDGKEKKFCILEKPPWKKTNGMISLPANVFYFKEQAKKGNNPT